MKVDGQDVTLHDLERTMLSLYWDETLSESDKNYLMNKYKEERMRYLDGIFQFDEQNRQRLKEVERLFEKAMRRMEDVCKRTEERETQKRIRGQVAAGGVRSHLEIGDLDDTEAICYSDEEQDLWECFVGKIGILTLIGVSHVALFRLNGMSRTNRGNSMFLRRLCVEDGHV